jgi:hypothetical protein
MSALGKKQTFAVQNVMSALPPKADIPGSDQHVCFVPIADIKMSKDDIKGSTLLHQWPALLRRCLSTLHPFPLPKQNSLADVHSQRLKEQERQGDVVQLHHCRHIHRNAVGHCRHILCIYQY